jgi:hypothetical protein
MPTVVMGIHVNSPKSENKVVTEILSTIDKLPQLDQERLKQSMNRIITPSGAKSDSSVPIQVRLNTYKDVIARAQQVARTKGIEIPKEVVSDLNTLEDEVKAETATGSETATRSETVTSPETVTEPETVTSPETATETPPTVEELQNPSVNPSKTAPSKNKKEAHGKSLFEKIAAGMGIGIATGNLLYQYLRDSEQKKQAKAAMEKYDEEIDKLRSGDQSPESKSKLNNLLNERAQLAQNTLLSEAMNLTKKHFRQLEQQKRAVSTQSGVNLSNLSQLFSGNAARDPRNKQEDLQNLLNLQSHRLNNLI